MKFLGVESIALVKFEKKINNNIDDLDTTILLMHDFVTQLIGACMLIYPGLPKTIKRSRGRDGWDSASTPQFLLA